MLKDASTSDGEKDIEVVLRNFSAILLRPAWKWYSDGIDDG